MGDETKATEAYDPASLDGQAQTVRDAIRRHLGVDSDSWPVEVYEDAVVVEKGPDQFLRFPYTRTGDDITFGDPTDVEPVTGWKATTESVLPLSTLAVTETTRTERVLETSDGRILESLDDGAGYVWRVTMIQPGTSRNGRRYRPEVLREAASLYEGAKAFDGHRSIAERNASSLGRMVGWHQDVEVTADGSLQSEFHISEAAPGIRAHFLTAFREGRPDLIGFSHDVTAATRPALEGGRMIRDVTQIAEVHSVDTVADPSAGGRLERLVASRQEGDPTMDPKELAAFLDGLTDEDRAAALEHLAPAKPVPVVTETVKAPEGERLLEAGSMSQRFVLREALEAAGNLPADLSNEIKRAVTSSDLTEAQIVQKVTEAKSLWDAVLGARGQGLPGQGHAEVTADETDKHRKALDGLLAGETIDGVRPFRSLKEAYGAFTGNSPFDTEDFNRRLLAESVGAFASMDDARRLRESIVSSSWSSALGDSITRKAIDEYQAPDLQTWRKITSSIVPVNDFRTQRRDRIGGYDVLTVVGEGGTYPALTSLSDEEATYAATKKGGTEDLTLETIANDDIGAVRRIPINLGKAAALTLYRTVWNTTIIGNATIYDSVALFDAAHANTTADAFDADGLNVLRNLMLTQARLGETSGWIGCKPKYVGHPPELFSAVWAVLNPAPGRTTDTPWYGLEPIELPLATDANDWFLFADPKSIPMLEVGFYQGREDPEILIQDAPAVGSVFTADKVTYKVRHIWGLTVLDYRGFQRGTQ